MAFELKGALFSINHISVPGFIACIILPHKSGKGEGLYSKNTKSLVDA